MPLSIGVLQETSAHEARVALTPDVAAKFLELGVAVDMEHGAGERSHLGDALFKGVRFHAGASDVLRSAALLLRVQPPTLAEVEQLAPGAVVVAFLQPHRELDLVRALRDRKITSFAMELIPRISRAQSMDALSSQAAAAGYKAALLAADALDKFLPMLTTAASESMPEFTTFASMEVSQIELPVFVVDDPPVVPTGEVEPVATERAAEPAANPPEPVNERLPPIPAPFPRPDGARIVLDLTIDTDGRVQTINVRRSDDHSVNATVVSAARQWRYRPATRNGVPVPSVRTVDIPLSVK